MTARYTATLTVPLAFIVGGAAVYSAWRLPNMPDPMAIHFSLNGSPNAFAAPWLSWLALTIFNCALIAILVLLARAAPGRLQAAILAGAIGLASALQVALFHASQIGGLVFLGVAGACALYGAALQPSRINEAARTPAALELPAGGAATWSAQLTFSLQVRAGIVLGCFALSILVVTTGHLIPLVIIVVAAALALAAGSWTIRADGAGLIYRAVLSWPQRSVAIDDITRAEVVELQPGRRGGFGYRRTPSRTSLITRGGPALRVTLTDGSIVEATCADPANGARVLNHYVSA